MKKVLLIDPSLTRPKGMDANKLRIGVVPPLGLAYVAAVVEQEGYEVKIVDCVTEGLHEEPQYVEDGIRYGLTDETIKKIIADFSPDIVGITCLFSNKLNDAYNVCRLVKEFNSAIPTVMGGIHPSVKPKETLENENLDFIVLGEGEYTFRDLIKALEHDADFSNIDGLAYKDKSKIVINPKTKFIEKLDEVPFPARHLLKMDIYSNAQSPHSTDLREIPYTTMISSRGCTASCTFCCLKHICGRKFRIRSAENVIEEINQLVKQYGIREIHFEDDNLTLNKKRALKIFEGLKKLGISWNIPSGSAVFALDEEIIEKMKESGAHTISLAIESGNQEVLKKLMHKPVVLSKVKPLVDKAKQVGLKVKGFFMVGYPGETKENIKETIEFARKLKLDWAHFFIAFPHYGTELRELCEEKGYLKNQDFDDRKSFFKSNIETPEFTPEYVKRVAEEANFDLNFKNNPNLAEGNYDRVIADFRSVIKLYPLLDFAHFYLGIAYEKKGLIKEARKEWKKALEINRDYKGARDKLDIIRSKPTKIIACSNRKFFLDKGRTAFSYILKQIGRDNKILLPSYIGINDKEGSGVFDPVVENKVDYDFYNLNKDLSIDMNNFQRKIKDPKVRSVLVIHYFGFVQTDIEQIAKICKKHDKYLIEDCAHSLLSKYKNKELGSFGDASFFSLHKILPMEGGGLLQINNPKIKDPKIANKDYVKLVSKFDLKKIAKIRRSNYLYLLGKLKSLSTIEILYPELPEDIVPLNFPILIKNKNRDKVYFEMQERGIELVSLYYRIIEQIGKKYSNSHYISEHITNLPIHQAITHSDIDKMIRELKTILEK